VTISENNINTSSKKFELGFINSLSERCNLEVIYIGKEVAKEGVDTVGNNITYKCINHHSIKGFIALLRCLAKRNGSTKRTVITSAYYPLLSFVLLIMKSLDVRVFSFIYDTHRSGTKGMGSIKRYLAELYFSLGFLMAKRFTGLVVLNEAFIEKLKIKTPYMKTTVGAIIDKNKFISEYDISSSMGAIKTICFAGTLNEENGVEALLQAYKEDEGLGYEINFYGYGELQEKILAISKYDERIKYCGVLAQDELQKKFLEADFLINLRTVDAVSSDYAFPSKLIDCLATGVPVISNEIAVMGKLYKNCFYPIKSVSKEGVLDSLRELDKLEVFPLIKGEVEEVLRKNNNWNDIASEVLSFVEEGK